MFVRRSQSPSVVQKREKRTHTPNVQAVFMAPHLLYVGRIGLDSGSGGKGCFFCIYSNTHNLRMVLARLSERLGE